MTSPQRRRRDRRLPLSTFIPDAVVTTPPVDPGFTLDETASFEADVVVPDLTTLEALDGDLFRAEGASASAVVSASSGSLLASFGTVGNPRVDVVAPIAQVLSADYRERRVRLAWTFDLDDDAIAFGLWADGDLLVRAQALAPATAWGGTDTLDVFDVMAPPTPRVNYHARRAPRLWSPRVPLTF